jgi:hypothetical protein
MWSLIIQGFMKPIGAIEMKIYPHALSSLLNTQVIMKINFLVFDRPPETLNKKVLVMPAASIHADSDA